ncbi:DUF4073 domain-containing protein [Cohnella sp. GbtcB17]|uniref:DUF4073 domain-containing protein n=1 Tax=Cohnella sp. GbtcB17 TaxID=2824762 RepID=UPI001C2F5AD3|nr:DUF4073 domain-containing protein [Cohnella sp. GbtcB17]
MRSKNASFVARLLVALLLLQPLLGMVGSWKIASAAAAPNATVAAVNEAADESSLLTALTDGEQAGDLTLPDNFANWDQRDLSSAMEFIKGFFQPSANEDFENIKQIQFKLDVIAILYASGDDVSLDAISGKINQILSMSSEIETLFPNSPDIEFLKAALDHVKAMSPADRHIHDTYIQNEIAKASVSEEYTPLYIVMMLFDPEGGAPGFSRPETAEDMLYVLMGFLSYADDNDDFESEYPDVPMADMGIDLSKAVEILGADLEADEVTIGNWLALAQRLIDQRPEAGYASVADVQSTIDNFLTLRAVNQAIAAEDETAMLDALTDPELGLKLPDGFENWNDAIKLSWAKTIMNFNIGNTGSNGNNEEPDPYAFTSVEQLQYVSDLVASPIGLLDDRSLPAVASTIDAVFEHVANFDTVFPDAKGAEQFTQLADAYMAFTPVEKSIYAYYMYLALTTLDKLPEGQEVDNVAGGLFFILLGLIDKYPPVNQALTTEQMSESLQFLQATQLMADTLQKENAQIEDWDLDLSKMNDPAFPEDAYEALSNWMLEHRPEGGFADLAAIQSAFNEFFTPAAPSVTADDNADKLVGADATMEYSTDDGKTWKSYDPENVPVFSGYVTVLVRVKENGVRSTSPTTTVSFNAPYVYVPSNNTETRYVDVQGGDGSGLARTPVTRTTDASGKVTDSVTLSADIAKEAVDKAKAQGGSTVRIAIPDSEDKISEISVTIPAAALTQINDGKMNLELSTGDGIVSIPTASLSGFGQDLYFRLVPVKTEDGRVQIETRAKQEKAVQDYVKDESIKIYGRPMQIETNLQSREASLFLPLKNGLPTDTAERNRILNHLGVYAEHSDGTKELIQGKVVTMNNMTGIQFTVQKFSTFAIVYADGLNGTQTQTPTPTAHTPYINGFGADFRPNAFVTRAQMAAMLARNLPDVTASAGMTAGSDVKAGHWAKDEILKAKSAGIMGGVSDTMFDPEGSVTRAQMAAIAARWMQKGPTTSQGVANPGNGNYSDVADSHWAADAISYVTSAGIMTGYAGQTFKPDQKLTRAEAVKVLNRLFGRGPLNGATTVTFTDVPATHWAFADIEEAATNHKYTVDAQGAEQIAVQ